MNEWGKSSDPSGGLSTKCSACEYMAFRVAAESIERGFSLPFQLRFADVTGQEFYAVSIEDEAEMLHAIANATFEGVVNAPFVVVLTDSQNRLLKRRFNRFDLAAWTGQIDLRTTN